jgi:hypothetical protein
MSVFYIDASDWVKYYTTEQGSAWIDQFWQRQPVMA